MFPGIPIPSRSTIMMIKNNKEKQEGKSNPNHSAKQMRAMHLIT